MEETLPGASGGARLRSNTDPLQSPSAEACLLPPQVALLPFVLFSSHSHKLELFIYMFTYILFLPTDAVT